MCPQTCGQIIYPSCAIYSVLYKNVSTVLHCLSLLELQLKARHHPYKLCRQWHDLLYRFTEASDEDISQGESLICVLH